MAEVAQMRRNRGLESVEERLRERLRGGCDQYEALQLYKTAFARYKRLKKSEEGMTFIANGSIAFSQENEVKSAEDLANVLIAMLEEIQEGKNDLEDHHMSLILQVANAMPMNPEKVKILQRAVSLASKCGGKCSTLSKFKDVRLCLAVTLSHVGKNGPAALHYGAIMTSEDVVGFVEFLKGWSELGYGSEKDLFYCRAAIHLLSIKKANEALSFWKVVIPELPYSPLVRFTSALVELAAVAPQRATKESTNAFENLQDRYTNAIARDEGLKQLCTRIGEVYFGVPEENQDGLMGSLMKMLL
eukprot:376893_1